MSPTKSFMRDREKAEKKLEIAIDKLVDVKDLGFNTDALERALEAINLELNRLRERTLMSPS